MWSEQLEARTEARNGVARIAITGELDMATVPILAEQLTLAEQDGVREIMLDLRDLTFVGSSGLRVFLQAYERAKMNGHRFMVIGASQLARRLFAITGTEFLLDDQEAVRILDLFTGQERRGAPTLPELVIDG